VTEVARPRHSIRFHGRSYHAIVLAPEPPVANWLAELDTWLERSPGFFFGRPVVLDIAVLQPGSKQGLAELLQNLAERNIKVMGIEGAEPSWLDFAMPPLLLSGRQASIIPGDNPPAAVEAPAPAPFSDPAPDAAAPLANAPSPPGDASSAPAVAATPQHPNSLLMDSSIRSGQCIVHPEGDVIVVGSVASGAEVIAGVRSTSMERCGAGRSPAHAMPARGFFAASSKPSFFRSTAFTWWPTICPRTCAASRFRSGSTVIQ
jgi:septum site-determining protein MinC